MNYKIEGLQKINTKLDFILGKKDNYKEVLLAEHSFFLDSINKIKHELNSKISLITGLFNSINSQENQLLLLEDLINKNAHKIEIQREKIINHYEEIIETSKQLIELNQELKKMYRKCDRIFENNSCSNENKSKIIDLNSEIRKKRDHLDSLRYLIDESRLKSKKMRTEKIELRKNKTDLRIMLIDNKSQFAEEKSTFFNYRKSVNRKIETLNKFFIIPIKEDLKRYNEAFDNLLLSRQLPDDWEKSFRLEKRTLDKNIFLNL